MSTHMKEEGRDGTFAPLCGTRTLYPVQQSSDWRKVDCRKCKKIRKEMHLLNRRIARRKAK